MWFEAGPGLGAVARGWEGIYQPCQGALVQCLAGCSAEHWNRGWMKAFALCRRGETMSSDSLPSHGSSSGAVGAQSVPAPREGGAVALWQLGALPLCCFGCSC